LESNLQSHHQLRDVITISGDGGKNRSPRRSESDIFRRRRVSRSEARRSKENDHVNWDRDDIPPVPPILSQLRAAAPNNRPLSSLVENQTGQ
jgi:hypothetical protein